MQAIRFHDYGPATNLRLEQVERPTPKPGEVVVQVVGASVNPIDWKIRSGVVRHRMPVDLPYIPGTDLAGVVAETGPGVTALKVGDRVMGMARNAYAEYCAVPAESLTLIPDGMNFDTAASLPLVVLTGEQLVRESAKAKAGQTILVTGALGAVGRSAVHAASELGCRVLAGVRGQRVAEAAALPGVSEAVALDDEAALAALPPVDCVADCVGGDVATRTIQLVKPGGVFGTAVRGDYQRDGVEVNAVFARPDTATLARFAAAVTRGELAIPIGHVLPLARAAEAHTLAERGGAEKIILKP